MLSIVFNIIIYAGIVQGLYSAMILTHTKLKNPANHYLAILLVVLSFSILHSVFIIPYFHNFHNTSFQIKEPFILLVVPFIWLYIKKLNQPQFHFKQRHLLHFVPFVLVMLFSVLFVFHSNGINDQKYYSHTLIINVVLYVGAFCQFVFYLFYMLRLIRSFKTKALNELSNTENIDPSWLRIFLITFLVVFLLLVLMMVIAIHKLNVAYLNNFIALIFALVIYVLGYKGLFQQTILIDNKEIIVQNEVITENESIETKVDEQLLKKLFDFMEIDKPYHDPELTLTSLAGQVKISRNLLSELINSGTGGNFYDFVNKYRVEEVKQLMGNAKFKDFTLLAIAFEAGFPSKSTFNSIFKKFTGLTPSEYRNRLF